ncbi:MAG: BCCT family transporter [Chitinophagaceae bacterium]|nr:MAG: BCCT family transporter [Chitinophagaceae bacterium]
MAKIKKVKHTLHAGVTIPSLIFIVGICLLAAIFPKMTSSLLGKVQDFIFVNLNGVYVWAVTIFVFFLLYLMTSKYGRIRLGRNDSKPEYSFFSWLSMLFAAGMGIGLMYFSVAEPIQHYSSEIFGGGQINRAKEAQLYTFFHWGIHAWAIYGVVGLALAYFAYRYRLPLSLRSCLYPILKERVNGKWGSAIDVFALCSTFFGITTTLGFGVVQINSGLQSLGLVPETNIVYQAAIVAVLVTVAILSAISGLDKGVRILSNVNVVAAVVLLLFVLVFGPTVFLVGSFTEGIGNYINNFFNLTFGTHVYEEKSLPWFYNWTILYWAWWISWSPYVGLFIARISKGRTIREFIAAVLLIPTLFNFIWMSVFGNSTIWFDQHLAEGTLSRLANNPDALMFSFLDYLPLSGAVSLFVILIIIIFFVTSADSGMYVMNSIATRNAKISPKWQTIGWGVLLAVLALIVLNAGGLGALQSMTLITALPFSLIIIFFIVSLMKALIVDYKYYEKGYSISTVPWSGEFWKERLKRMVSYDDKGRIDRFIETTVKDALEELREEFANNGVDAKVKLLKGPVRAEIEIRYDVVNNFVYGVLSKSSIISDYIQSEENLPDYDSNKAYYPMSYFGDAREGYDVRLFTKNELISDVLKHYERFIGIISEGSSEMFVSSNANDKLK